MKRCPTLVASVTLYAIFLIPSAVQAESTDELIARARSAAPAMISSDATVVYKGETLARGSNGWTCMPETLPGDESPHCSDGEWMQLFKAFGGNEAFTPSGLGFSYMLGGDGGVSNSDPHHSNPAEAEDFIREGPHLMLIVPRDLLNGVTDDPSRGGPYVMWKDTPYAHIMVPVGDRP